MKRNRVLVVSALLASLGPLVGNGLYAGPSSSGELPAIAYAAYTLELVGLAALTVLLAWLVTYLFDRAPVAAVTTAIAGGAMVAVKIGSAAPTMTLHAMADTLDPVTAEALVSMNGQSFVLAGFLMSLAFLAAGVGLLATGFPRWLSWWAAVAGGLGVVAGTVGVVRPDAYLPIPFLLLLAWMIAVAIATVMRPGSPEPAIGRNGAPQRVPATE